ncbi:MAG TPA: small, acid-soluble spore protein, alpha/beta type [Syntrophomonadaceae bacterium]|nr:small, acid-soluble spore protein, alpha/beta type [Syntrophomonadaceae bacterium]HPR93590.1 small, acid-soluble spore protein, alpha/beta type [Syntrophomonadaceae bacterium]
MEKKDNLKHLERLKNEVAQEIGIAPQKNNDNSKKEKI